MMRQVKVAFTRVARKRIVIAAVLACIISLGVYMNYAHALTAILVPNQTEANAWTRGTAGCTTATTGHTCVDEGTTPATSDVVATGTDLGTGVSTTFHIADQPNIGNATSVTVYYYAKSVTLNGSGTNADTITTNLSLGGTSMGASTAQPMTTTWQWYSVQYNTGNWNQAQVNNMKTTFTRTVVGGGNSTNADDDVQIATVYVRLVYTPSDVITQAAYRWFGADKTRPSGVYSAATTHGTGTNPEGVVADDFNNDQIIDIATANIGTDNISVLLGNGGGTFAAKVDYAGGDGAMKIISTDLNNDQKKDLVVVNANDGTISVLLGNGDGTFAAKVDYAAQTANSRISSGDFNNDGFIDIITTGSTLNTYSLFLGSGDGTLNPAVNNTGSGFRGVAVADINADQKQDLIIANTTTNSASVMLGNGDGTFAAKVDYPAEIGSASVAVADFNNDQKADIVIGSASSTNVSVLLGNGDGTFASKVTYPAGNAVASLVAADVNGDRYKDIVTFADSGTAGMRVLRNNGNGTFAAHTYYSTSGSAAFGVISDVNQDGAPDAVVATKNANAVAVLLNGFNYPALSAMNTRAVVSSNATNLRLRINLGVTGADLETGASFKLRYQAKSGACSTNPAAYTDVTSSSLIRYYNDPTLVSPSAYVAIDLDPVRSGVVPTYQTYNENNNFSSTSTIPIGQDGLWDLSLATQEDLAPGTTYCLIATREDNTALDNYVAIPEIAISNPTLEQSNYRFYRNADSVTPGSPLAAQNTKPNVPVGSAFRLRQLLRQTNDTSDVGASFKLQAAEKMTSCSAGSYATLSAVASSGSTGSTGFKSPNVVQEGSDGAGWWSNPQLVKVQDNMMTDYYFGLAEPANSLYIKDFSFNVPAGVNVTGVEMRYIAGTSTEVKEDKVYLTKDGSTATGTNMAAPSLIASGTNTKGSATNLWGVSLTPGEVNSVDFGSSFAAIPTGQGGFDSTLNLDHMSMNIHYSSAPAVASFTDNAGLADGSVIATFGSDPTVASGSIVPQSYSEDETASVRTALQTGDSGLWDFALRADESLVGKTYCFRMAESNGTALASYTQYPEVTFTVAGPTLPQQMRGGQSVVNGLKRAFNW